MDDKGMTPAESAALHASAPAPRKRPRWGRRIGITAAVLVIVAGVAVVVAPSVAGSFLSGYSLPFGKAATGKDLSLRLERASLSWFSGQTASLTVFDGAGNPAADVTATVDRGLLALLRSSDLGLIKVIGNANLVRYADGSFNIVPVSQPATQPTGQTTTPPASASSGEPITLPAGLKAKLDVKIGQLTYTDDSAPNPALSSVTITDLAADADLEVGQPLTFNLSAATSVGDKNATPAPSAKPGSIKGRVVLDKWSNADGTLTIDPANLANAPLTIDAQFDIAGIPTTLIDAFATANNPAAAGKLAAGLGPDLSASVTAKGDLKNADARLTANATGLDADVQLAIADGLVTASKPGTVRIDAGVIAAFAPPSTIAADPASRTPGQFALAAAPQATITIQSLSARLPKDGNLDLRGAAAVINAALSGTQADLVMEPGAQPRAVAIPQLALAINTTDLAGTVRVTADGSATIDGAQAGLLKADLTAGGLLNAQGAPNTGLPAQLQGSAELREFVTALAQPFVADLGLDLPSDLGPTLNVRVDANTTPSQAGTPAGALPPLAATLTASSQHMNAAAAIIRDENSVVRTIRDGISFRLDSAGAMASAIMAKAATTAPAAADPSASAPITLSPTGAIALSITDLVLPMPSNAPDLANASAKVRVNAEGFAAQGSGEPLAIDTITLNGSLAPASAPAPGLSSTLEGNLRYGQRPMRLSGDASIPGLSAVLTGKDGLANLLNQKLLAINTLKPQARLALTGIPAEIASFSTPAPNPNSDPTAPAPLDLVALVREAVGPVMDVNLTLTPAQSTSELILTAGGQNSRSNVKATVDPAAKLVRVDLGNNTTLSQALLDTLQPPTPGSASPRLTSPAKLITATTKPFTIPLNDDGSPDLARAGELALAFSSPADIVFTGVQIPGSAGAPPRDAGPVSVSNLKGDALFPVAAVMGGSPGKATFALGAAVADAQGQLGILSANADADLATINNAPALAGKGNANVVLNVRDLARIDALLQQKGVLTDALGASVEVTLASSLTGNAPFAEVVGKSELLADVSAKAERLTTSAPLSLAMGSDRLEVRQPWKATWTMVPAFANRYLVPEGTPSSNPAATTPNGRGPRANPGEQVDSAIRRLLGREANSAGPAAPAPAAEPLRMTKPSTVQLSLGALSIALPKADEGSPARGPLFPGIFALDLNVAVPNIELTDGLGTLLARDISLSVNAPKQQAGRVNFETNIASITKTASTPTATPAPAAKGQLSGFVENLADASGNLTPDAALITAKGSLPGMPTTLIDALSLRNGLLTDLLGESLTADLDAQRFGKSGGTFAFNSRSTEKGEVQLAGGMHSVFRAVVDLKGRVENNTVITPLDIELRKIDVGLGKYAQAFIPVLADFTKAYTDTPASIKSQELRIPIDGDMTKLSGTVTIDPGEATFSAGGDLAGLLKQIGGKESNTIGRRLEPLTLSMNNGVVTYQRWKLPLGEFFVETEGSVDMTNNTLDIITWVPLGALTDEAAGIFNTGIGKIIGGTPVLEAVTMIPIRTSGPFDNRRTAPDLEAFAKNAGNSLRPQEIINNVGGLLEGILNRNKKEEQPANP